MKCFIALLIVLFTVSAAPISADIIYDWTGETDGGRTATGVLTLANSYTPGTALSNADFLAFSFSEPPVIFFSVPGDGTFISISGSLPPIAGTTPASFSLQFQAGADSGSFIADSAPSWAFNGSVNSDAGGTHNWVLRQTLVPEPASTVIAGLFGLAFMARRRR